MLTAAYVIQYEPRHEKIILHVRKKGADERLSCRYIDSTKSLLPKSEISSHLL